MTRALIGMAAVWMMTLSPALANPGEPLIKVVRDGNQRTVTLQSGALHVTQTLAPSWVEIRLALPDDVVRFSGALDGRVTVERGGERRTFHVRTASQDDRSSFNDMLDRSAALAALDALLQSDWAQSSQLATVFRTTREVIRVLQGEYESVTSMAVRRVTPNASLLPARQRLSPSQCWETYNRDVVYFTYELQSCLSGVSGQWWNPLATAWCAYEYNLKSSLAGVWLLDCYGAWA